MWVQLLISLFIVFVWWRLFYNFRTQKSTLGVSFVWFVVWLFVVVIFWPPEIASRLAIAAGIGRGADLIVYISIVVLVYLAYRIYARMEKIERGLTSVTRELALYEGRKKNHRSDSDREL